MSDGIGLAEALLGLDGFRVLDVTEGSDELVIRIETTADVVGCTTCGTRAEAHDRKTIRFRDGCRSLIASSTTRQGAPQTVPPPTHRSAFGLRNPSLRMAEASLAGS